ncbi:MAG TPA: PH domain-containing protein [Jatrophihabitans sp.]|nr:PH domain-containing protein [Jatrophihabitans sp.]
MMEPGKLRKFLIPSETPVVITRRHWASLLKSGLGCLLGFVLALIVLAHAGTSRGAADLGVLLLLLSLGWSLLTWVQWHHERFVVTDRRVLLIYGLLTQRVGVMPLVKVTDLTYERSLAGRLLGYGAFVVESAGQHQAFSRIDFLPSPDRLYHDVSMLLFRDRPTIRRPNEHPTAPLPEDLWRWP